jgi:hypothetical protein
MFASTAGPSATTTPGADPEHLEDRIIEAQLHGWLGEVEGLQVSLAGVNDKLTQIDTSTRRAVDLGTPALPTNSWLR